MVQVPRFKVRAIRSTIPLPLKDSVLEGGRLVFAGGNEAEILDQGVYIKDPGIIVPWQVIKYVEVTEEEASSKQPEAKPKPRRGRPRKRSSEESK